LKNRNLLPQYLEKKNDQLVKILVCFYFYFYYFRILTERFNFRILIEKIRDDNYRVKDTILGEEIKDFRVSKMYKKK